MKPWPLPKIDAVLALDLATKTGYSFAVRVPGPEGGSYDPGKILTGTWDSGSKARWSAAARLNARHWDPRPGDIGRRAAGLLVATFPEPGSRVLVAWEDVEFVHSRDQIVLWSGIRAALWASLEEACLRHGLRTPFYSVPVGTLKKFATGSGSATKQAMDRAAVRAGLVPASHGLDDNGIDARWILEYALRTYSASTAAVLGSGPLWDAS